MKFWALIQELMQMKCEGGVVFCLSTMVCMNGSLQKRTWNCIAESGGWVLEKGRHERRNCRVRWICGKDGKR
jgi:hypothetical protein